MSDDKITRSWFRAHNQSGIVTLHRSDDSQPVQSAQIEGYSTEIRDGMQRHQHFGMSSMPLPGSKGIALYQAGARGSATVISVEDPRYRPRDQKPGTVTVYMVDEAKADGSGGTMRALLTGALGWAAALFGKTIAIGDSNTSTVTITGSSLIKLAGDVEITGKLKVDGATTVQDIAINGAESGRVAYDRNHLRASVLANSGGDVDDAAAFHQRIETRKCTPAKFLTITPSEDSVSSKVQTTFRMDYSSEREA